MRVSMSAIGSLMLMQFSLPARLDDAGHFALERQLAQLVAAEPEFAVDAARPPGQCAAVAQPHRRSVARQLLQLDACFLLRLVGGARILQPLEQSGAGQLVFLDDLPAFLVAVLYGELGHAGFLSA